MGVIGNIWVKLGLKKDAFEKGMKESVDNVESFGNKMANIKAVAVAAWAAIAAAVAKFAKDSIQLTQAWGDKWSIEMAAVQGAYEAFVRQLSSGEGWNNLFANMREAYRIAKEVASSLDEVFERKVSLSYEEAETNRAISELQLVMRDASKSDAERKDAAKQIIELERQLGRTKKDVYQQEASAQKQLFMSQTGLNEQETDYLLKNYNLNRDIINQARAYYAERKRLEGQLSGGGNNAGYMINSMFGSLAANNSASDIKKQIDALDSSTSQAVKDVAKLTTLYDKSNDALVQNMAQAEISVINVDTEINRASTRATAMLGSLTKATAQNNAYAESEEEIAAYDAEVSAQLSNLLTQYEALHPVIDQDVQDIMAFNAAIFSEIAAFDELQATIDDFSDESAASAMKAFEDMKDKAGSAAQMLMNSIQNGLLSAFDELLNVMNGMENANFGTVVKALITPLADAAIMAGTLIMSTGEGIEALKTALMGFLGVGAVAAGAIMVGLGVAAKAGLSAIAGGSTRSSYRSGVGTSYSGGYSGYTTSTNYMGSSMSTELSGTVTVKGSDLQIALTNYNKNKSR